jgi:aryl-alcohol dehydrogenase-like predicted oxidoreductase
MKYRKLGNTELTVSEIGFGTYAVSGVYGSKNTEDFREIISKAIDLGITYFDTAPVYGDAENLLGATLKGKRDEIILATKFSLINIKDEEVENYINQSLNNSLNNLQTDFVDLYFVHFDSLVTPVETIVSTLEKLKEKGKIRYYGIGHINIDRINEYRKLGEVSAYMVEMSPVQMKTYMKILPLVQEDNSGLIAFSTTGRGIMSGKMREPHFEDGDIRNIDPAFYGERLKFGLQIADRYAEIGKEYGKSPIQVGLNYILSKQYISCALIGPSSTEHLIENVDSVNFELNEKDLKSIDAFLNKEQENLDDKVHSEIKEILTKPLSESPEKKFKDLVYVIEEATDIGLVDEREILPIFQKLFFSQKMDEQEKMKILEEAKNKLKEIIFK